MNNIYSEILRNEIEIKKDELSLIEENILDAKIQLFRLRRILVPAYSDSRLYTYHNIPVTYTSCNVDHNKSWIEFEQQFGAKTEANDDLSVVDYDWSVQIASDLMISNSLVDNTIVDGTSRFYTKRQVIIGNTTQYLKQGVRIAVNKATHKWMIYVRTSPNDPPLHTFVKSVYFFLHPTYSPNDIVILVKPPYQITRFGWGEFPVRVQLHFKDTIHKPVDILHHLKLDSTRTGQQMLGNETRVFIDLLKCNSLQPYNENIYTNRSVTKLDTLKQLTRTNTVVNTEYRSIQILHGIAKRLPLYGSLPYGAVNINDFNKWNIVKQRAIEWMRAIDIKKIVQTMKIPSDIRMLTTRSIVNWCRINGHTPNPTHNGSGSQLYCKHCGQQQANNNNNCCYTPPSISCVVYNNIFTTSRNYDPLLEECSSVLPRISNNITNYRIPQSLELKWIHQTCLLIGIHLFPQTHDGMLLHVTDHMIFSATSQFLHQLLMSAVTMETACSSFDWRNERIITPALIYSTIMNIIEFDFLTNNGLMFL